MIGGHDAATAPVDADRSRWLRLQARLADLALGSGTAAAHAQHTVGRHLAFLPPEALELDLGRQLRQPAI